MISLPVSIGALVDALLADPEHARIVRDLLCERLDNEPLSGTLGERLERLMFLRRMTRKELALKAGVSYSYLSNLLKGERVAPTLPTLTALAEALDEDVSALI